jgi:hypothetical protein
MPSIIKVDQIQSDTGTVNLSSNVAFTGTNFSVGGPLGALGNKFEVQDASSSVMEVRTTSGGRRIRLQASDSAGALIGTSSNHGITFMTNNTGRLSIPADAAGITFPASQAASADPNTLDDYEEGTWTPVVVEGSINGAGKVYEGRYTKIGSVVTVQFLATSTDQNLQVTSYVGFSGLPFAPNTYDGTGVVTTEDIDVFARNGFCAAGSNSKFYLSACGSAGGTSFLFATATYTV